MSELLKEVAENLNLMYISDLKQYGNRARICRAIKEVRGEYSAKEWQDAVRYITGKEYPVDGPVVAVALIRYHRKLK